MHTDHADERIWRVPEGDVRLWPDAVHVWRARLDQSQSLEIFFNTLAADERERAVRFQFARHRTRFIVARGVLRAILSRYLNTSASRLSFHYGAHDKPFLAGADLGDLRFNISHSDSLGLFAFTLGRELGVDVEQIRNDVAVK